MEDRPTKKRKIFQDVLPAEMIENIALRCSNTTLESLACTCKQINAVVSNIFEKSINVRFKLFDQGSITEKTSAEYSIEGNGDAIKKSEYYRSSPGSSAEKIQTIRKKLDDRAKFNKLVMKLLDIINTTDMTKIEQIIKKYEEDPLFNLSLSSALFEINVNSQQIRYKYKEKEQKSGDESNKSNESDKSENKKPKEEDPDLDTTEREDWNTLDSIMIKRLKCALCAIKVKKFYKKIGRELKANDFISIKYVSRLKKSPVLSDLTLLGVTKQIDTRTSIMIINNNRNPQGNDDIDNAGWELDCYDTGYVTGQQVDWSDRQWNFRDDRNIETIQYRPSIVKHVFKKVAEYILTLKSSKFKTKKEKPAKKQTQDTSDSENKDNEDENSNNNENSENNEEDDNDGENSEEEEVSRNNEEGEQRRREVVIRLNGMTQKCAQMSEEEFEGLMNTLVLVTLPLGIDLDY